MIKISDLRVLYTEFSNRYPIATEVLKGIIIIFVTSNILFAGYLSEINPSYRYILDYSFYYNFAISVIVSATISAIIFRFVILIKDTVISKIIFDILNYQKKNFDNLIIHISIYFAIFSFIYIGISRSMYLIIGMIFCIFIILMLKSLELLTDRDMQIYGRNRATPLMYLIDNQDIIINKILPSIYILLISLLLFLLGNQKMKNVIDNEVTFIVDNYKVYGSIISSNNSGFLIHLNTIKTYSENKDSVKDLFVMDYDFESENRCKDNYARLTGGAIVRKDSSCSNTYNEHVRYSTYSFLPNHKVTIIYNE